MARKAFGELIVNDKHNIPVYAATQGQYELVQAIEEFDIIFVNGPAGCGKTFVSSCMAVSAIDNGRFKHLVLTRPIIESGENLGFLPGTMEDKVEPFMRPLIDSIEKLKHPRPKPEDKFQVVDKKPSKPVVKSRNSRGWNTDENDYRKPSTNANEAFWKKVEIAPLAYMRGATYENAFIILDEAQNVPVTQMKMLLTRLGKGSKVVICGDAMQTDLDNRVSSGFRHAQTLLQNVEGIGFVTMDETDIVRHKFVKDIIMCYEKESAAKYNETNHLEDQEERIARMIESE